MARTNNVSNYLSDVASAIKNKKGNQTPIQASSFDTEINNLPTSYNLDNESYTTKICETKTINHNSNYDGMNKLTLTTKVNEGTNWSWSELGYITQPKTFKHTAGYDFAKNIYDNWDADNPSSLASKPQMIYCPLVDTSKMTSFNRLFNGDFALSYVPVLDTSSVTNMDNMFNNCNGLCDETFDNAMQMCINASNNGVFTGSKVFMSLFTTTIDNFHTRWDVDFTSLPHYQALIDAGWTIE